MVFVSRMAPSWSVLKSYKVKHGLKLYKSSCSSRSVFPQIANKWELSVRSCSSKKCIHTSCSFMSQTSNPGGRSEKAIKRPKRSKETEVITYTLPTKEGDKKDVSCPLPQKYSWQYVEAAWYPWWQKAGFFTPDTNKSEKSIFMMCLPPPNVTGVLHLGHAMTCSIQDAITRWNRMHGRVTLWNPGSDHAGISTQVVVEKKLWKERQMTRHDLGRDLFLEEVWKWKNEKGSKIYEQMKKLGASLDWSRECFTLDPKLGQCVTETFVRLHDEGLIYRNNRLVNWCCTLKSAISDIEVDNIPLEGKVMLEVPGYKKKVEFGTIHSFAYPVEHSDEEIVVATTRIETMLGDTAVMVHPSDPRYTHLHGRFVLHPLCGTRIPILCDDFVDKEFGTGAVKITPAHDQNDYEAGERHGLPNITVIDDSGHMTNMPQDFMGLHRFDVRSKIIYVLKEKGLYRGWKENPMALPLCSRTGDVIEPKLKDQWFVNCTDMAENAIQAVKSKDLQLIPDMYEKQWFHWLGNIKHWCISRQLWWGHRIPAYRVIKPGHVEENQSVGELWVVGRTKEEAVDRASQKLGVPPSQIQLKQDEDVLDTWFSSALFPFSIFGWPDSSEDFEMFYPNSLLETANDILFFWVARMVMMGHKLTGKLPFKQVLLHGVLRDAQGRKMSKSLGNVIDPMDVIHGTSLQNLWKQLDEGNLAAGEVKKARKSLQQEFPNGIPACGTDALRFTLCSYNYKALSINMDLQLVIKNRNFCNKMWQAFRFFMDHLGFGYVAPSTGKLNGEESKMDLWILSRMSAMLETCDLAFTKFDLHHATTAIQQFWTGELCDIYLEYVKQIFQGDDERAISAAKQTVHTCVDVTLRAVSPFMPFLAEELYQRWPACGPHKPASVAIAPYPCPKQYNFRNEEVEEAMSLVLEVVHKSLSLRVLFSLTKSRAPVCLHVDDAGEFSALRHYVDAMKVLSRSSSFKLTNDPVQDLNSQTFHQEIQPGIQLCMQLEDVVEYDKCNKNLVQMKEKTLRKITEVKKSDNQEEMNYDIDAAREKEKVLLEELSTIDRALWVISTLQ